MSQTNEEQHEETTEELASAPSGQQKQPLTSQQRTERRFEVITAILLGVVAVATAWSGYQATRWAGEQSTLYARASALRVESTRDSTLAGQFRLYDVILVNNWINAYTQGNTKLADIYERRFRTEFLPTFKAWLALDPFNNPNAPPGPHFMPQYKISLDEKANQLDAQSAETFDKGQAAKEQGDAYVLNTVLLAVVLFYRRHRGADSLPGTVRMCSITDIMTAVAITFLIASITGTLLSNAQQSFSTALSAVLAELPVYGLTFLIVGFYWLSHHRIFMVIRRHDMTLIWLNFGFLVCIELQPLFNGLQASYPASQTTSILYALEQVATGLMLLVIWWYAAYRHRLIDRTMDRFEIMTFALRALLVPMLFLLSIAIVVFHKDLAFYFWLLVIVLTVADLVYRRVRHRPHSEVQVEADV